MVQQDEQERRPQRALLHDPLLWPFAAAQLAADACLWWLEGANALELHEQASLAWTTPNKLMLELATMRLRDFSGVVAEIPALVCAPYALHGALLADFAPGHSVVEALRYGGVERLYVTDWRSADSEMRFFSIDNYLADLNVAIDEIGPPVDLIGLCQGGWLSLIYAARFPKKVRRLALVGTPADMSVESKLSRMVAGTPEGVFEGFVNGEGGLVRGDHTLGFWTEPPDAAVTLQRSLKREEVRDRELLDRFNCWYAKTLDLPGVFYLQVVNWIFRENRLANGTFVALGRDVRLGRLESPIFLLAGSDDEVVPAQQAMATAFLLGTPASLVQRAIAPSTHLGLFVGGRTLADSWPRIAEWLRSREPQLQAYGAL